MDNLINNEFVETKEIIDNIFIKTISVFKIESNLEEYVKKFINIKSFPYINTDYGKILENYIEDLDELQKVEIVGHLEDLLINLNKIKKDSFMKLSNEDLLSLTEAEEIELQNREELYNGFKGGEYGEMFLSQMLYTLGYEKILSKLAIQWGELSPTGIDVPYINLNSKTLILCESKFWKNFNQAFKSIKKDIDDILDKEKLDNEVIEWKKRIRSMPNDVRNWFLKNKNEIISKKFFEENFKIIVFGVVICNEINYEDIKKQISKVFGLDLERKYKVYLMAIPIEDKNKLIAVCEKCIKDILSEVNSFD